MNLNELRDRVLSLPALEKRRALLVNEIHSAEAKVHQLLRKYQQESRDVENMQKDSFSNFLRRLVGRYDSKLELELWQEADAKLQYDNAIAYNKFLQTESNELASRITALRDDERKYKQELDTRRAKLFINPDEPAGQKYARLEAERIEIISQKAEISEVLAVISRAKSTAKSAMDSLDSAETWSTIDTFTRGGFISYMAKYSHIDDAEANFQKLSSQIKELRTELNDVRGVDMPNLNEISSGQRAVDFWFDNIFTDLSVHKKIGNNIGELQQLVRNLNTLESKLRMQLKTLETELAKNKKSEEMLLISQ